MNRSDEIEQVLKEHKRLLREFKHREAMRLLLDELVRCYQDSPISHHVALLLDELAIDCKDLEHWDDALIYLSQSAAIKRLIYGSSHPESIAADQRVSFILDDRKKPLDDAGIAIANKHLERIWQQAKDRRDSDYIVPEGPIRLIRCLVIAKRPAEMFFGRKYEGARYVVAFDEGQIGGLMSDEELELGTQAQAKPVRLLFGCMLLKFHSRVPLVEAETPSSK